MIYLLLFTGGGASATTKSGVLSAPFINSVKSSGILTILILSSLTLSFLPPACSMVFSRVEFLFLSPLGIFRFSYIWKARKPESQEKHGPSNFIEFSKFQILLKFLQLSTFLKIFENFSKTLKHRNKRGYSEVSNKSTGTFIFSWQKITAVLCFFCSTFI